jgi:hypothetical protein
MPKTSVNNARSASALTASTTPGVKVLGGKSLIYRQQLPGAV